MRKLILLSGLIMGMMTYLYSQTTLTTAVDFTVTDTDGNTHNLFSYLNDGKYVCLDFFFVT